MPHIAIGNANLPTLSDDGRCSGVDDPADNVRLWTIYRRRWSCRHCPLMVDGPSDTIRLWTMYRRRCSCRHCPIMADVLSSMILPTLSDYGRCTGVDDPADTVRLWQIYRRRWSCRHCPIIYNRTVSARSLAIIVADVLSSMITPTLTSGGIHDTDWVYVVRFFTWKWLIYLFNE